VNLVTSLTRLGAAEGILLSMCVALQLAYENAVLECTVVYVQSKGAESDRE
jgi:hypothetical protein